MVSEERHTFLEHIKLNLKNIKLRTSPFILAMIGLVFNFRTSAQTDTVPINKNKFTIILGAKLFATEVVPEVRVGSIFGVERTFSNKKISLSYRNFFNIVLIPRDTFFNKNIFSLVTINVISITYKINIKNSFIQLGIGPYHERQQSFTNQYFLLINPHYYGIDFSMYTKLKWLQIGYRHQIQLFSEKFEDYGFIERYRFSLCIEIPINIK